MNINTDYRVRTAIEKLVKIVEDANHYKTPISTQSIRQELENFAEAILDVTIEEVLRKLKTQQMAEKESK